MHARRLPLAILAIALLCAVPVSAHAAIVNGGFETGTFAGWTVIGDASVQTASVGISPTNGCCMALLTTINTDWGGVPFSLNFAAGSFAAPNVIGSFLGYSPSELSHIPGRFEPYPVGQSGIKQTVQGHAGEVLSFDSYWVTMDGIGTDGGVVSIVPSTSGPKVLLFLNPTNSSGATETGSPVPLCQHDGAFITALCPPVNSRTTGWQHFDVLLSSTDTFTIGFAVWNSIDSTLQSALFVDNVQLRVPQASSAALLWVGLLGLLFSRRWILRAK